MHVPTTRHALDPFAPFHRLRTELERLFDPSAAGETARWVPPLNVHETDSAYEAHLPVPGLDPERLEVHVESGVLRVAGERAGRPDDAERLFTSERFTGSFERTVRLPQDVDGAAVAARLEHGVLTITLPKAAEARARRVPVSI
jgi:HSP20 family protein